MRKAKLKNIGFCFITGCFIKPFKIIIDQSVLFLKLIRRAIFAFRYQGFQKGKLGTANS